MDFFVSPGFIVVLSLLVLALIAAVVYQYMLLSQTIKQRNALMMKSDMNLEEILNGHEKDIMTARNDIDGLYKIADKLHKMSSQSLQKVGVVRFNPFAGEGDGGDQSFAIAILDEKNNGFVISSLHARTETRVYTKPITDGSSSYHLSEEEAQAVKHAQDQYKK